MVGSNREFLANQIGVKMPHGEQQGISFPNSGCLLSFFVVEEFARIGTRTFISFVIFLR